MTNSAPEFQSTGDVMMIRPVRFMANEQTALSNRFQTLDESSNSLSIQRTAADEFDALAAALRQTGVTVHQFDDTPEPHTPDSLFPNNWVSFHCDGTVVLYPMLAANRRAERRMDIIESLSSAHGFRITRTIDLTHREQEQQFLEGTGSLVLDRVNRIAYACLSPRTDMDVLGEFAQRLDYEVAAFEATDMDGAAIYHTNVMMSVGTRFAAVCSECIEPSRREAIQRMLAGTHEVIELSYQQMSAFAGNMLELRTPQGLLVALSEVARNSLTADQRRRIEATAGPIVSAAIPTIERYGGGSVRCMIAEVHLPKK